MKRLLSVLLIATFVFGAAACTAKNDVKKNKSRSKKEKSVEDDIDFDELKKNDGIMFSASNGTWGLVCDAEDYWSSNRYVVYYDGTLEVTMTYHLSGSSTITTTLSDDDYEAIYEFAYDAYENDTYEDYEEIACDGDYWSFSYYDTDEEEHELYYGYAYSNKAMLEIEEILEAYKKEGEFTFENANSDYDALKKFEGYMFIARNGNSDEYDNNSDVWTSDYFMLKYDGTLEISVTYNLSGTVTNITTISDEDYKAIYDFAYNSYVDGTYDDYDEDGCDGDSWTFTFVDENGEEHRLYMGYAYADESMNAVKDILKKYREAEDFSFTLPEEGVMFEVKASYLNAISAGNQDEVCGLRYVVNYDHTLALYECNTLTDEQLVAQVELDDTSFEYFWSFCASAKRDDAYSFYTSDDDSDVVWNLTYFDKENEPYLIFEGSVEEILSLNTVVENMNNLINEG